MAKTKSFKFVYIPADGSEPMQELEQEMEEGKEVESLLDRVKAHFASSPGPGKSPEQLAAQKEQLLRNLPAGAQIDARFLEIATSMRMVENISLLSNARENGFVGVNLYVDDEGSIRGQPSNPRASEIARVCGKAIDVRGDAFLARVMDDGDAFDRLDLTLAEVTSDAGWVAAARAQNGRKETQGGGNAELERRMRAMTAGAAAPAVRELTPAESAKDEGNAAFRKGDWEAAVQHYSRALELDASMGTALNNRALCHVKLRQYKEAEADCTAVLARDPSNVKAFMRRATARDHLDRSGEAAEDLRAALALQPHNKEAAAMVETLKKRGVA